jgi:hypothetical protein
MGLLVHGIVAAEAAQGLSENELAEAAGRPIRTVLDGAVAALVSEVPGDEALPSRANLLAHTELLGHVTARTTVLPMRFGVVVPDDAALREDYMAHRQQMLGESLDRLRGFVEMRVRASYVEEEVIRSVLDTDRLAARLRGRQDQASRMQLGERIAKGIDARKEWDGAIIRDALAPRAEQMAETAATGALDVLTASFLVPHDDLDKFEAAVGDLQREVSPRVALHLTGPLPLFSFSEA